MMLIPYLIPTGWQATSLYKLNEDPSNCENSFHQLGATKKVQRLSGSGIGATGIVQVIILRLGIESD